MIDNHCARHEARCIRLRIQDHVFGQEDTEGQMVHLWLQNIWYFGLNIIS